VAAVTLDCDQLCALAVLRYWFGPDLEVLAVLEHNGVEGVPGDTSPGLASQQLALTLDDRERTTGPLSSTEAAGPGLAGAVLDR